MISLRVAEPPSSRVLWTGLLAGCLTLPLAAQSETCPVDSTTSSRICQAGLDALTLLLPLEGALVSGGNPVPGTASAMGKFGHFRLAARVGVVRTTLPKTDYDGASDTVAADKQLLVPAPRVDLDIGLLSRKLPLGTAAVDFLASSVLLPTGASDRYQVDQTARTVGGLALGLGYGIRIALVMPSPRPTVSLSILRRDMPTLRFGDLAAGDRISLASNLSAINVRLMVGGKVKPVTLAFGAGMDLYKGKGSVSWADSAGVPDSSIKVELSTSRITTALNAAIDLGPISLWGEGGFQVGKDDGVVTVFERVDTAAGRFYGGLGVALQF